MAQKTYLKSRETKPASKVFSVRIPEELHDRITSVAARAEEFGMELDVAGIVCEHLVRVVDSVEKELRKVSEDIHREEAADIFDGEREAVAVEKKVGLSGTCYA